MQDSSRQISLISHSFCEIDWPDLVSNSVSKFPQVSPESVLEEPLMAVSIWLRVKMAEQAAPVIPGKLLSGLCCVPGVVPWM